MSEKLLNTHRLPDKPSELILLALADEEKAHRSKKYAVEMISWHYPHYESGRFTRCDVCFAGAVMAWTLGVDPRLSLGPDEWVKDTKEKLFAIDLFRRGHIYSGLEAMNIEPNDTGVAVNCSITHYENSRKDFRQDMKKLATRFKELNL